VSRSGPHSMWQTRFIEHRTVQIRAGQHVLTAEDPLPLDLRDALTLIK
jgi:hypothetical protein